MFECRTTSYSYTSICTGKVYEEGWFIWMRVLNPSNVVDDRDEVMICHIINDTYNTNGDTHGYLWRMVLNPYINGWLSPHHWYKTKEEALEAALKFIDREISYVSQKRSS